MGPHDTATALIDRPLVRQRNLPPLFNHLFDRLVTFKSMLMDFLRTNEFKANNARFTCISADKNYVLLHEWNS